MNILTIITLITAYFIAFAVIPAIIYRLIKGNSKIVHYTADNIGVSFAINVDEMAILPNLNYWKQNLKDYKYCGVLVIKCGFIAVALWVRLFKINQKVRQEVIQVEPVSNNDKINSDNSSPGVAY